MIRIEYPSIDEAVYEGNPVLRGVIDTDCLKDLRIDPAYQREYLSNTTRKYIMRALIDRQRLPDIELGMRGENWEFDKSGADIVLLKDPVFIIDGQQRRGTILEYLTNNNAKTIRQGAIIHFNTKMEWERERFQALNLHQTRVSSSLLLRNLRSMNNGIATLYGLTVADQKFPLVNRVGWAQSRGTKDLVTSTLYIKLILILHGHIGSGIVATSVASMSLGCTRLVELTGLETIRNNTKTFWDSIETIWGIKDLQRPGATWMKASFLTAYANVLSDHRDFWQNSTKLTISAQTINKLKTFPINDPEIKMLAASSGVAHRTLQFHIITHLNHNMTTKLSQRPNTAYENRIIALKETVRKRVQRQSDTSRIAQ